MLTKLRLENFKAWKDTGDIRLAPLTVLFGTNSAGKSSIPQLLLLLKQTARSPAGRSALHMGDEDALIDAGSYVDVVHGRDLARPLGFALGWSLDAPLRLLDATGAVIAEGDHLAFAAQLVGDRDGEARVDWFRYRLGDGSAASLDLTLRARGGDAGGDAPGFELVSSREGIARAGAPPLPPPSRFHGFPDEVAVAHPGASFAPRLAAALEEQLRGLEYVGPLREPPRRVARWSGEAVDHVGSRGEHTVQAMLAAAGRRYHQPGSAGRRSITDVVAARMAAMGLVHDLAVEPAPGAPGAHETLVRTSPGAPRVRLTEVGFGVGQVLPVVVECFVVPCGSTVVFEQPEMHLHPRVQADLADLFVDAIRAHEDGAPRRCQFVVESHSEHFLRRLQRRIAEEALSADEVALHFVGTDGAEARIEELDVDAYGNIKNWPEAFFGDEMADLVARSEAQARRMPRPGRR